MTARRTTPGGIRGPIGISALVHVAVIATAAVLARSEPATALPPVYRVQLFAAPPGPRQMGVVQPRSAPAPEPAPSAAPATPPAAPEMNEREMPAPIRPTDPPRRPQQVATPNPAATRAPASAGAGKAAESETKAPSPSTPTRAPVAGGGPTGGRGADVANVDTPGIDFPYPSYLRNIARQVISRFAPPENTRLVTQVRFTIRRDGSVTGIAIHKGSGNYEFDTEARAAIESAARLRAFGPLPDGYPDDALTVYFAFDPNIIR